jgi:hypothetical protein
MLKKYHLRMMTARSGCFVFVGIILDGCGFA